MSIDSQMDAALEGAKLMMAKRLLRAMQFLQQQHIERVSKPVVKIGGRVIERSKPGEYPRLETGHGRTGVVYAPQTPEEIVAEGLVVRLGQMRNSWYMLHLELHKDRLGFIKTADDLREMVKALITGAADA